MNLLYTLTAYPPCIGGAQLHQHMLARQLAPRHTIQVVTLWNSNRTDWLLGTTIFAASRPLDYSIDGITVHRTGVPISQKLQMLPALFCYYPFMRAMIPRIGLSYQKDLELFSRSSDLIHNVRIGREAFSYASFQVAKRRKIPFVFTPLHHPRWVGWRYKAYLELYKMADVVIALTNAEKEFLKGAGIADKKICVTGIGPVLSPTADASRFKSKHSVNGPVVLFLGQHYPYKGYRELLESAAIVWQKIPETHFVFIGPAIGSSENIFKKQMDHRIHRLPGADLQEKTDAIAACSLLCVPSTQESFGGVYTEAWSFGKAVIGCNIPAVAEVIDDEVNGFLVDQQPTEIADRICELLLDDRLARQMGESGRSKVKARYTWEKIAACTEEAYHLAIR